MSFNIVLNIKGILVGAIICFSVLTFWFSTALFGKIIKNYKTHNDQPITLRQLGFQFVFVLLFCLVMEIVVDLIGSNGMNQGVYVGIAVWLLISLIHLAVSFRFDKKSILLKAIYSGYFLVSSVISAALLSMWR